MSVIGGESVETDSEGKACVFCPENGFVSIIDETSAAYLVQVVKNIEGSWVNQIGRYFIIPNQHIESILERPNDWTRHENILLWRAIDQASRDAELMQLMDGRDLMEALNTNWNNGEWAGQLVLHSHLWVLFRYDSLKVGMDGMILEICDHRKQLVTVPTVDGGPVYHEPDDPQF